MSSEELRALLDEREIRAVLMRYCRGVDRLDEELIRSCYHPDSTDDHGMYKGPGLEFGAYCVKALRESTAATLHTLGQSLIELDGDTARCETYVVAYHRRNHDGGEVIETFGGRYVDRLERRDGAWKIADRIVVREWDKKERVDPMFPPGRFQEGIRSRKDLAFDKN